MRVFTQVNYRLKSSISIICGILLLPMVTTAQTWTAAPEGIDCDCWLVSDNSDALYTFNSQSNIQTLIGNTGVPDIEAMTYGPEGAVIYAADAGDFGKVNIHTGVFTFMSAIGSGNGDLDLINFTDVDGLGYSPEEQLIYATVRRGGNDLLIKIDPNTGEAIGGVFGGKDYLVITGVGSNDVDDITIDHTTGTAYVISSESKLYVLDLETGAAELIGAVGASHIEGMGIDAEGNLFGSVEATNEVIYIDKSTGQGYLVGTRPSAGDAEGIVCYLPVTISGNVYNDYDGLSDNSVDGEVIDNGLSLYAVLYDNTTGKVADREAVNEEGFFSFQGSLGHDFTVYITTTPSAIGEADEPVITAPAGYEFTGENNCGATAGCGGSDGSPDGMLALGAISENVSQANFGVNQPPVAEDDISADNDPGPVSFYLHTNDSDQPDGSSHVVRAETIHLIAPDGEGTTEEDKDADGDIEKVVVPGEGIWEVSEDGLITFTPEAGFNGDPTPIKYTLQDEAGLNSNEADIIITYLEGPLSVDLIDFSAQAKECDVQLSWSMASETHVKQYEIEYSRNGNEYSTIAVVPSQNYSQYSYIDHLAAANGYNYYRLHITYTEGRGEYSNVISASVSCAEEMASLYPNPADDKVVVSGVRSGQTLIVTNVMGQHIQTIELTGNDHTLFVSDFAPGMYYITIVESGKAVSCHKVIKN